MSEFNRLRVVSNESESHSLSGNKDNRLHPYRFIPRSHSDDQSESCTKFYNSSKPDVGGADGLGGGGGGGGGVTKRGKQPELKSFQP